MKLSLIKFTKNPALKKIIDITWVDDSKLFNQISNDVTNSYRKKTKNQLNYYLFKTF